MKNKKRILGVGLALVAGLSLASCGKDKDKDNNNDKGTTDGGSSEQVVNKYTITYNTNGHGSAQAAVSDATALPQTLPTLTADGYTFEGWYLDAACTTKAVGGSTITTNVTLYAKWTAVTPAETKYSVTYNINGHGTAQDVLSEVTALPETLPTLTEDGYVFGGWYLDEALTTEAVAGTAISANTTLYAKWTAVTPAETKYSVTYNINGHGTAQDVLSEVTALPETLPTLTEDGYVFGGWYLDEALTTEAVAGTAISANTTLYAKWTEKSMYQKLTENPNNIYHNDFETAGTIEDITSSESIWSHNRGIYFYYNQKDELAYDATKNNVVIADGILKMTDLSNNGSQAVVVAQCTEGVVEGTVDLILQEAKADWTFMQFYGYSNSTQNGMAELIGLRTDDVSKVKYRTQANSQAVQNPVETTPLTTNLSVYFKFNLETGKATITVNGAKIVEDLDIGMSAFEGFKIVSADRGNRYINADNISIVNTELTVEEYKTKVTNYIDKLIAEMDLDKNYITNKATIEAAVVTAKAAITSATTKEEVLNAVNAFNNSIANVESEEDIARNKKDALEIEEAIKQLPALNATNVEILAAEDKIKGARETYENAIDAVKKYVSEESLTALKAIEEKLEQVKKSATPADTVIGEAKDAIDYVNSIVKDEFTNNYTLNIKTIEEIQNKYITAINAIISDTTTITEENKQTKLEEIKSYKTNCYYELARVLNDLEQTRSNKKTEIANYYTANVGNYTRNKDAFDTEYKALLDKIGNATTIAELEDINTLSLEAIKTDKELAAYDALPTVEVDTTKVSISNPTLNPDQSTGKNASGSYGVFTIVGNGLATTKNESSGYGISFKADPTKASSPTIKFKVSYDGATFMLGLYSKSDGRKVILTDGQNNSTILDHKEVQKLTTYTFDGEETTIDTTSKGYLVWENLAAGEYTVTFASSSTSKAEETKVQTIYLFDHAATKAEKKVLSLDAEITGTTRNDISVNSVVAIVEGEEKKVTLSSGLTYKYYGADSQEITDKNSTTTVASVEITYTNGDKYITETFKVTSSGDSSTGDTGDAVDTGSDDKDKQAASYETGTVELVGEYLVYTDPAGNKTIC